MIGLDWLRQQTRRTKPATGGIITPDQAPPIVEPAGYLMPTVPTVPTEAKPIGYIEISDTVTEVDAAQIRQQLQITPRPSRSEPLRCPCVAIYSECRCPDTNIRARTTTADFHADQR